MTDNSEDQSSTWTAKVYSQNHSQQSLLVNCQQTFYDNFQSCTSERK